MILISDGIWPQSYGVIQAIKDADAAGIERFALNVSVKIYIGLCLT